MDESGYMLLVLILCMFLCVNGVNYDDMEEHYRCLDNDDDDGNDDDELIEVLLLLF